MLALAVDVVAVCVFRRDDRNLQEGVVLSAGVDDMAAMVVGVPEQRLKPVFADIAAGDLDADLLTLLCQMRLVGQISISTGTI